MILPITIYIQFYEFQIGMIMRGEADIAVTDIFSTVSRSKVVDFSTILEYAE